MSVPTQPAALPPVVDQATWRAALDDLRRRVKAATRELDAIAAQRRRLPMVRMPDYTLIGEELYAASAYLGREPLLLGSLKAQDYAKAAVIICALLGALALNIAAASNATWGLTFKEFFKVTN